MTSASTEDKSSPVYKLKRIDFFGRKVPIALQNENGPCPLLAIANILLLKKQIELPEHAPDISQNRLVSLVAGHLLDANDEQKVGKGLPEEYKANLRKNVADAIGILSKLTTGIDVNVRFHDVKGFEFTNEIAIFDLMDISLVHGWLVDPQDKAAASSLGQRSYNEVVEQLVMILGDATPKRLLTPQLSRRASGFSTPRRTSSGLGTVTPSELLSPTEVISTSKQLSDGNAPMQIEPSTGPATSAVLAASAAGAPNVSGAAAPELADAGTEAHAAPTGAMTSSDSHQASLSKAEQAGGPIGSLVSAQQTPTASDSPAASATDSHQIHQAHAAQSAAVQPQTAMISPAAEMASRAYPLPAAPLEGGGLTTQSSGKFDAHIASAPTPYPSLASELSQATNSPLSSKGSAANAAFSPADKGQPGSPATAANTDSKSRFAPADPQHPPRDQAMSQAETEDSAGAVSQAPGPSDLAQDPGAAEPGTAEQHASTSDDLNMAGLHLDTADDEQLQLALAISLGKQEASEAQGIAEDSSVSQAGEPQKAAKPVQTPQADTLGSVLQMPVAGAQQGKSEASKTAASSHNAAEALAPVEPSGSNSATASEIAGATGSPHTHQSKAQAAHKPQEPAAHEGASVTANKAVSADAQQGAHSGDDTPTSAHHGMLEEHQLNLLSPDSATQGDSAEAALDSQTTEGGLRNEQTADTSQSQQSAERTPSGAESKTAGPRRRTTSEQDERSKAAAQAHIIQDFLDSSSSQLTYHGLGSLREGLRPNELAVFFRNNHFNTIFLHKGTVHILVTDQGYEFEKNVVWEKLDDLMGNTQFLKADFTPYGSNSLAEQVSDAADLVQAAFAGVGPTKGHATNGSGAVDADFALALQLQEEEQRRAARDQQSRQQAQQQQQGQRGAGQSRQQQSISRSSQARGSSQGRPPSGRSAEQGSQSFANPIMQRQQQRQTTSQQAQQQQQERPSTGSAIAKWFGWGSKK